MTRSTAVLRFALALSAGATPLVTPALLAQEPTYSADSRVQDGELFTVEELDNLLAPVALYPDPILAQLFIAATYPEQVALAARYVENYGTDGIDDQRWDVSVRSIAHYSPVLNMLVERPNWATAVGRAYATQPGDVMASVQSLRRMARAQGNLQSTEQQRVEVEREYIRIVPAQPRVVYVPVYDPYVVYYRPVNYVRLDTPYWSFGVGFPIGAWLNYDLDWDTRVVYYHGWNGYGRRHTWYHVSRPFISYNSIYIGSRYTVVAINRTIYGRHVNYGGFGYYNTVHRNTGWDRPRLPGRGYATGPNRAPQPDRYGVPSSGGSAYRPDKRGAGNVVPRVGGSRPVGGDDRASGGRPSAGGERPERGNGEARGNGNGRGNGAGVVGSTANVDRVKPVRIGGNERPLYPRGEDRTAERGQPRTSPEGFGSNGSVSRGRDADPVRVPRASAERISPASSGDRMERSAPRGTTRSEPRYEAPRAERSAPRYESPRTERSTPRYESPRIERSAPRVERSTPRAEVPRSQPRSQPRAERSEPRSAPRASAPRAPESRSSAPRGGSSGSAPRAPRGGSRDRG